MTRFFPLLLIAALLVGCATHPEMPAGARPLATRHSFQLRLERSAAAAGDLVMSTMTFTNTGREDLWVPPRSQIAFGWKAESDHSPEMTVHLSPSECSGIKYRRLRPGEALQYELGFVVPYSRGKILVYLCEEPNTQIPFEVR